MAFEREKVPVVISTSVATIKGIVHLPQGGRLTDFINNATRGFVPLTDVRIEHNSGKLIKTSLLQVNKNYIIFILPEHAIEQ